MVWLWSKSKKHTVAVGMTLPGHPPHRSVLEESPRAVPTSGRKNSPFIGIGCYGPLHTSLPPYMGDVNVVTMNADEPV